MSSVFRAEFLPVKVFFLKNNPTNTFPTFPCGAGKSCPNKPRHTSIALLVADANRLKGGYEKPWEVLLPSN